MKITGYRIVCNRCGLVASYAYSHEASTMQSILSKHHTGHKLGIEPITKE